MIPGPGLDSLVPRRAAWAAGLILCPELQQSRGWAWGGERQEKGTLYLDVSVLGPEGDPRGQPAASINYRSSTFLGPRPVICWWKSRI